MRDTPEQAFASYIKAFETLDPEAVLRFYHAPSIFIAPQGVFSVADANEARVLLARFMSQMKSQSYKRTEVVGLTVSELSPILVCCAGEFLRFNAEEDVISRVGFTYTLRYEENWKIVVAALYEPRPRG